MKRVAVTGGIGSGKSCAVEYIKELGYPCFSCDEIYKEIAATAEYQKELRKIFPTAFDGDSLNKGKLSEIIFLNEDARKVLNSLSHPLIMKTLFEKMDSSKGALSFAEVPLLFEGGFQLSFDYVLVITRPLSQRINSIMIRDHISEEAAILKIQSQFNYEAPSSKYVIEQCNGIIINNDTNQTALRAKINHTISQLQI